MSELIRQITLIRHTQVIEDPFPTKEDKDISIYKAYKKGYDKAYQEIEEGFLKRKEINDYVDKGMKDAYNQMVESIKVGLEKINEDT